MKYLFILVAFCLSIAVQASTITITFSPDNPIVGQPVNFTSSNYCAIWTLDPGDGSPVVNSTSMSFLHTYTAPGNYTPLMGCSGLFYSPADTRYANSGGIIPGGFPLVTAASSGSAIPTLGEWGLIILGIIIMGVGLVSMRQKRIAISTVNN